MDTHLFQNIYTIQIGVFMLIGMFELFTIFVYLHGTCYFLLAVLVCIQILSVGR